MLRNITVQLHLIFFQQKEALDYQRCFFMFWINVGYKNKINITQTPRVTRNCEGARSGENPYNAIIMLYFLFENKAESGP